MGNKPSCVPTATRLPQHDVAYRSREVREFGEHASGLTQDGALGIAEHSMPGLLRAHRIRPGELDRVLQVIVVHVEELERRAALLQQVLRRHWTGARHAEACEADLTQLPHVSPRDRIDAPAHLPIEVAGLERGALARRQEIADVVANGLDDAEAREQLQVDADAQEPRGVAQVPFLVHDVVDERIGVQRGLVDADRQHGYHGW